MVGKIKKFGPEIPQTLEKMFLTSPRYEMSVIVMHVNLKNVILCGMIMLFVTEVFLFR